MGQHHHSHTHTNANSKNSRDNFGRTHVFQWTSGVVSDQRKHLDRKDWYLAGCNVIAIQPRDSEHEAWTTKPDPGTQRGASGRSRLWTYTWIKTVGNEPPKRQPEEWSVPGEIYTRPIGIMKTVKGHKSTMDEVLALVKMSGRNPSSGWDIGWSVKGRGKTFF